MIYLYKQTSKNYLHNIPKFPHTYNKINSVTTKPNTFNTYYCIVIFIYVWLTLSKCLNLFFLLSNIFFLYFLFEQSSFSSYTYLPTYIFFFSFPNFFANVISYLHFNKQIILILLFHRFLLSLLTR